MNGLLLLAILLVGALIRAWPVFGGGRPLWFDEVATWSAAQSGLNELLRWMHHPDHPPLSYLLVHASMAAFQSDAEWVLRLPSLVAGLLCMPSAYLLGRLVHGPMLAVLLAGLVAFDPNLVDQSQQARMYSLFMLFLLLLLAWMTWMLRSGGTRSPLAWAGVGTLLALLFWASQLGMLVWLAVLVTGGVHAWRTWQAAGKEAASEVVAGMGVALGMAVGWCYVGLAMLVNRLISPGSEEDGAGTAVAMVELLQAMGGLFGPAWVSWTMIGAAAVGLWRLSRKQPALVGMLVVLAGLNVIAVVVGRQSHHLLAPRYLMAMQPALWLGVAWTAWELARLIRDRWEAPRLGWAPAMCTLGWLALFSTCAFAWYTPTKYLLGEQLLQLRDRQADHDHLVFYPEWTWRVAYYNRLIHSPSAADWSGGLGELEQGGRLWLVVSFIDSDEAADEAQRWVGELCSQLGLQLDEARLREHLKHYPAFAVGLGSEEAMFLTPSEFSPSWMTRW